MQNDKKIILVTGGSGLVWSAIKDLVKDLKNDNEEYMFLSSKDGDLSYNYFKIKKFYFFSF